MNFTSTLIVGPKDSVVVWFPVGYIRSEEQMAKIMHDFTKTTGISRDRVIVMSGQVRISVIKHESEVEKPRLDPPQAALKCPHDEDPAECEACFAESDHQHDAARERRFFS